jgi:predicted nucleotidyltransferase
VDSQGILAVLRNHKDGLRARGVQHAALFGSAARKNARPDSDIDILVEFDPNSRLTVFDYAGVKGYIAGLFDRPVDVIDRDALKPRVRQSSERDAVYAF